MNTPENICITGCINCCGKSLNEKLMIQRYVNDNIFPQWVLTIYEFLQNMGFHFYISSDEGEARFHILNVPEDLRKIVHKKTYELGLIFRIHKKERAIYRGGHPLITLLEKRRVVGFMNKGIEFEIREPRIGEDISEIYYTLERDY